MLTAHNISKTYDFKPILDKISFSLNAGERVGLIIALRDDVKSYSREV
jgi:ABC-type multidrug transport system ATPase subunit